MRYIALWLCLSSITVACPAGEILFTSGPQEFGGRHYYWLAEWKLELTLPEDVTGEDRVEVLFGSKGPLKRTMYFSHRDQTGMLADVRHEAYEWVEVPTGPLLGGEQVVLFGKGRERVAFIAGVRLRGPSRKPLGVKTVRSAIFSTDGRHSAEWADLPGFELTDDTRRLWDPRPERPDWRRAERSSKFAGIALSKIQRWLHEACLPVRDERSGLFRPTGAEWNYRDTAADCYPFYVWAAFYTDKQVLDTIMVEVLEAEQRLCNHLDRLPVRYNMDTGEKVITSPDAMVFGASEYAKDGLVPIVEITGKAAPWFGRLRGIVDDLFQHASVDTPYGMIPSTNIEVNGELLQILPRLYCMTDEKKYLDWAHRLADYYLLAGGFVPTRLSDHGCEIIGGLGLLFAIDQKACPEKLQEYQPHLEFMFDEILRRGTNSDGLIIGSLQDQPGPHDNQIIRDGWGYDFVGFLDYELALENGRYREAIRRPLENLLKARYFEFNWDHGSRDNVADSVEGGLYLLRRFPNAAGFLWADREIATLLVDHSDANRLWGVHKLEANTVRTVVIHTMLHTRNTIARPWQQGLQLGAAPCGDGICVFLKSETAYQGTLQFDIPRHRLYMGFDRDWPRMNCVPEWFTVEPDAAHQYTVEDVDTKSRQIVTGECLSEGLPIQLTASQPLRLVIQVAGGR